MAVNITKLSDLSVSSIKFSDVTQNKMGGKAIYLNSPDGGKILLKLRPSKAIVGVAPYYADNVNKKNVQNYKLPLAISEPEDLKVLGALNQAVLDVIKRNEAKFFTNKKTLKDMMVNYKPFLQQPEEGSKYSPLLKTNVIWDSKSGKFETAFYDAKGNDMDPLELVDKRGLTVTVLLQLGQVYNTPAGFGLSIRVLQVKVADQAKVPMRALLDDPTEAEQSVEDEEEYEEEPEAE